MARLLFLLLPSMMVLSQSAYGDDSWTSAVKLEPIAETFTEQATTMKIRIGAGDRTITATMIDNETARDFISLLPLTLTMNDLFGREKFGHLPRAISERGRRTRTYEVGDVIYWPPGPDVAMYYCHDGESIPSPGIIVMGKMDSGVEALNVPGSVKVTIELIQNQQ